MSLTDDVLVTVFGIVGLAWLGWSSVCERDREEQARQLREKHVRQGIIEGLEIAKQKVTDAGSLMLLEKAIERHESQFAEFLQKMKN